MTMEKKKGNNLPKGEKNTKKEAFALWRLKKSDIASLITQI